ncbi:MAG: transcription termination factor Rho [Acidobacteriota bacterium]
MPGSEPQEVHGVLEVMEQGFGFLRHQENNYLPSPDDIYVPTEIVRSLDLEEGLVIGGMAQPSRGGNVSHTLTEVATVNGGPSSASRERLPFSRVVSLDPEERIRLETTQNELSMRVLDLITPIGKGQRGLIVAPPKTGKTTLLKKIANAVTTNHPEMDLTVLLVDERPEEVTDFRRSVKGEVIASSSDEMARNHVSVAEIVIEKARRMVEFGKDSIILLDSLTRLSRAYNVEQRGSGKILSGGIDSRTMERPKKFFGAARNAEQGGSLTIIATALIDTGSRMDEVIFQEFKGTGNMELQLDRRLFDRRIFPCADIALSGTRKEEKLFAPEELVKVQKLRRALSGMDPVQAMDKLLKTLARTGSNEEFLAAIA